MGTRIVEAVAVGQGTVEVFPVPIIAQRSPTTTDTDYPIGQQWIDQNSSPVVIYNHVGNGTWLEGGNSVATTTVEGIVMLDDDLTDGAAANTVPTSSAAKDYIDGIAIAGSPDWDETTEGILERANQAEAEAGTSNLVGMSPLRVFQALAGGNATISAAAITGTGALDVDTTGAISLDADAASNFSVAGGGIDLTLASAAGRVIINGEEAAANAITLLSAAGGIDADAALQINIASSQNAADAIRINASAGGIDIDAAGAAGEDITINNAAGSISITSGEAIANSLALSSGGGIDILAPSGGAGIDIDIVNTGGSINISATEGTADALNIDVTGGVDLDASGQVNIASSQNAADAVSINASAGGIEIVAVGAAAEDLVLQNTNGSVNVVAGEADAASVSIQSASGGLDADFALSCDINSSQAAATAININASNAAGGITMAAGTGGILIGNQADCSPIDIGDIAPTASRTITIGGGTVVTASVTDLIDIGPDGATTNADSIKQVDINTGTVATGQSLTNIATGAITSGTHTVSIQSGNATAGTVACNISTGTGTKTVSVGNADGGTTTAILGPVNINTNQNNNIAINSGTSTGTITIGNTAAGAVVLNSGSTIAIGDASAGAVTVDSAAGISIDAATASNFTVTGATEDLTLSSVGGSVLVSATENAALAIRLHANGGISETIQLHADQGTGAGSINLLSDVGGITLTATGLASNDAINLEATAGGVDVDAALQINIASSQAASSAIVINASDGAGGIQLTAAAGVDITSGDLSISGAANKLQIETGAATDFAGTGTLVNGVDTIANTNIATGDYIFIQRIDDNSSSAMGMLTYSISNGVSFTVTSLQQASPGSTQTGDQSTFAYFIVRPL